GKWPRSRSTGLFGTTPQKTCGSEDSEWAKRSLAVAIQIKLGSWTDERRQQDPDTFTQTYETVI
ncbi:hypothetical protein M9458_005345, partial [Cirrhinus mrigala]